jgi:5-formyltetrahydrofolate cyclo-ligase
LTPGPREHTEPEELSLRAQVKRELRVRMRAIRGALPRDARLARSEAIIERLCALPLYEAAPVVVAFHPIRGEVDLRPLYPRVVAAGKTLALPRVDFDTNELVLHVYQPGDPIEEGGYGILEPSADAPRLPEADGALILCPGLAVDERGHRVGYGGGYYDRLLARRPSARAVAVAFDFQLIAEAPIMPGDVAVEAVVTDARVIVP